MSKSNHSDLVTLGVITKPHGIRGEVCFHLFAESADILLGSLFLRAHDKEPSRPVHVESYRFHHGMLLLRIRGVSDRNGAEALRQHELLISRNNLPELSDDELYYLDILGLQVVVAKPDGTQQLLGSVTGIDAPAGQELWQITTPDGKEILLPAVPEFVQDIDLDAETVVITPPPGLLELYLEA